MRFLVVIETPQVESYLFASPWLRETRGASVHLDFLNRREIKGLPKELGITACERIYLGGGSGRFLFESDPDAERFKNAVLDRYHGKTVTARVAVQKLTRKPSPSLPEWIGECVRLARLDKTNRLEDLPVVSGRWLRPCASCGTQPAEITFAKPGDPRLCCPACLVKRGAADKLYSKVKPGKKRYGPL
jgi:hypothetical protein